MFGVFILISRNKRSKMKRAMSENNSENEDLMSEGMNVSSGGGSNSGGNNNNNSRGQKRFRNEETIRLLIPSRVSSNCMELNFICAKFFYLKPNQMKLFLIFVFLPFPRTVCWRHHWKRWPKHQTTASRGM